MRPWQAHVPGPIFLVVVRIVTFLPVPNAFVVPAATATRNLFPRAHGTWSQFGRVDGGDKDDYAPHALPSPTDDSLVGDDCEPDVVGGSDGVTAPPSSSSLSSSPPLSVLELDGPFDAASFVRSSCWGKRPCLVRDAFDAGAVRGAGGWPTWEDVLALAEDEDAESRLITHIPGDETSYELTIGPFEDGEIEELFGASPHLWDSDELIGASPHLSESDDLIGASPHLSEGDALSSEEPYNTTTSTTRRDKCWTLLVNDVDRFLPTVSDWMWGSAFGFVPTWRRDDGQASIACAGGGIGPHVDDYDVFLVQTRGAREWRVGTGGLVSHEMEDELLVPGIDVRILGRSRTSDEEEEHPPQNSTTTLVVKSGDFLYLPPRVAHQGTALTDDCATLSVGCRAPSASDLISRIAEEVGMSNRGTSVVRYADDGAEELLPRLPPIASHDAGSEATLPKGARGVGEITPRAKRKARDLVKAAMSEIIDDDDKWDAWFGSFVTEPTRVRHDYPIPLAVLQQQQGRLDGDDGEFFAEEWRDSLGSVWGEPNAAVRAFREGKGYLNQAEGIKFAYSISEDSTLSSSTPKGRTCRLFVNGQHWDTAPSLAVHIIANERRLSHESFADCVNCSETRALLEDLVARGFLYLSGD